MRELAHSFWIGVIALAVGCASGTVEEDRVDGAPPGDAFPCSSPGTWYEDVDEDGHGSVTTAIVACDQPAGHVSSSDDCNDAEPLVYPGAVEQCDGLDNDCSSATADDCPPGCTPMAHDGRIYLWCTQSTSWTAARAACMGEGFHLVRMDDATENAWVRSTFGAGDLWIGGTDSAIEARWVWDGGTDQFWQGGSGGFPVGGLYVNWEGGEPNDNGTEDCAEMKGNGQWNDTGCGDSQPFICERF